MEKLKRSLGSFIVPLLSIILAFVIGGIIMAALGANPFDAVKYLFQGAFGSKANIGTTLTKATPLMFTSLCACFAYKCGVFNLGGEGQFLMGSIAAFVTAYFSGVTGFAGVLLALLAGTLAGGIWGMIPGLLKIGRGQNEMIVHNHHTEPWKVTVVDTGLNTMTGGRIKRIRPYIGNETFMMTYGDGVCDVDIAKLAAFHRENGKIATLTAVQQEQQKGVLDIAEDNSVRSFREKKASDGALINAGYMVLEPQIFDYLDGDACVFEQKPLQKLAEEGQLMSYIHKGFWQCMDTAREKQTLEKMLATGNAPWKKWED